MEICEGWRRNELEVKEREKKNLLEKPSNLLSNIKCQFES